MKIINHCVIRKIGDAHDHYLLINTLNAFCLILSFEEMEVINKWRSNGIAINERNTVLYKTRCLKDNGTTYDKILNGITDCLKNGIPIRIRMNVSENNLEECLKGRMKLKEQYKEFFDRNLLSFELQPLFQLDATIKQKITTQVLYNFDRSTEKINQMNTLFYSSFPLSRRLLNKNYKFTPRYCNCDAEESKRFYDPEGNIYSCVLALGKENTKIGTYYPQVISKSISMLDRNIETIPKCKECLFRFLCGGGCANESIDASGNPLHPSCRYMEQQLLEVTDFIKEKLDEEMSYCC
ncbi:MAG: SPASM domain-containing protein [Butyrivibrio sp.]|nr:SPASM domain-containing protein [Butyrivibrio sp.]